MIDCNTNQAQQAKVPPSETASPRHQPSSVTVLTGVTGGSSSGLQRITLLSRTHTQSFGLY